mgnify:CR=1 FL=1
MNDKAEDYNTQAIFFGILAAVGGFFLYSGCNDSMQYETIKPLANDLQQYIGGGMLILGSIMTGYNAKEARDARRFVDGQKRNLEGKLEDE